jgi:dienelactone hydrolase
VRPSVAAVFVALCVITCTQGGSGSRPPASAAVPPVAAPTASLLPYYGSYSTDDGDILVIARLGWFFDLRSSAYRTIYATGSLNHFTIGMRFLEPVPKFADLVFGRGTLAVAESDRTRTAHRIAYRHADVTIPALGARLAGTITEPPGAGPHPGIVVVHGAEPGERHFYDVWVGVYVSLGLAVLTYDKRGIGSSTGTYPGEQPTAEALQVYADDAAAALDFLSAWPGIDPARVGFHGGSQGGWTVPLAIARHPRASFAVLASAPATTVDQTDLWAGFSGGGAVEPTESTDQMLADVRRTHSGYDPTPALQALGAPALWLLGTNDRTVPTAVCLEILNAMHKPNFTIQLLPSGHALLVNPTGLLADDARSPALAPDLVPALTAWLRRLLRLG